MSDIFTNVNTVITIIAIILGLPTMIFLYRKIKKQFFPSKLSSTNILNLKELGLIIENEDILYEPKSLIRNNIIFWPVVPTAKPNIIHLLFVFYVRKLNEYGLKTHIFIFDNYYKHIIQKSEKIVEKDVDNFINVLNGYGLQKCNIKYFKESEFVRSKKWCKKIFNSMTSETHLLTYGDIKQIQKTKTHINDEVAFARFMKPFFNMLYLKFTSNKYGFTLSGLDEQKLWHLYRRLKESSDYKLCNFYIPTIEGLSRKGTHVLDKEENICYSESQKSIFEKVKQNFENLDNIKDDTHISIYIRIIFFGNNRELEYKDGKVKISIDSWENLLVRINQSSEHIKTEIYTSIAVSIYKSINNK